MKKIVKSILLAGGVVCLSLLTGCDEGVKVSSFGYDPEDSTAYIQKALDSGASRVVFDRQKGPWVANPVYARSNTEIVFEEGVELVAKRGAFKLVRGNSLLSLECVTNVAVRGLGKGATLRMWKKDYQDKAEYKHSEWRHALNVMSSKNVLVENMSLVASGGDGIYLGVKVRGCANTDVLIRNCVCDDNHRQGISVISAENLLIEDVVMKNTAGTPPESGIDFEPNAPDEKLVNCVMRNCTTENNRGAGYDMYFGQLNETTAPVSITLENCRSVGDRRPAIPLTYRPGAKKGLPKGGFLKVKGCTFKDSQSSAVVFSNKPKGVTDVSFEDCVFENCPVGDSKAASVRLLASGRELPPTDGFSFRNVTVRRKSGGDWLQVTKRPWIAKGLTSVAGEVTLEEDGVRRTVRLDDAWRREVSPSSGQKLVLSEVAFDPSDAQVVDTKPGVRAKQSPLRLRYACDAIVYAAKPGPVTFAAKVSPVNKQPLAGARFLVTDLAGKKTFAKLAAPTEKPSDFVFSAPKAGFYRLVCDVKPHALVFVDCDAPLGFRPPEKTKLDVFASGGDAWFYHRSGVDATLFFAGGVAEYVTARVFDPSGKAAGEWRNAGDWGFRRLAPGDPEGLWSIRLSRPDKGYCWEDSYLDRTGAPAVFFLTNEKYWK